MSTAKRLIQEDWERMSLLDKIYLQEDEERIWRDARYAEFVAEHEGKIIVERDETTTKETKIVVISDSKLPF